MKQKDTENSSEMSPSRRKFLKTIGTAAAGVLAAPYLKPSGIFAYNHKRYGSNLATVAITNTTGTPAESYTYNNSLGGVKQKVKYILDLLDQNESGKLAAMFSKGKKVALKINMTGGSGNATNSKLGSYSITEAMWTHPAVIQAVGQYAIDCGVTPTDIYIVDAFWDTNWQDSGSTAPFGVKDAFGYLDVQKALGCNAIDLNDTNSANLTTLSTGSNYYKFSSFNVNKILAEVDVYVSIPKLKQHSSAGYTGALKNQIGMVPKDLYTITNDDYRRGFLHHAHSSDTEWNYLPETVCDMNVARPVHLSVIDAIKCSTGGEGAWCTSFAPVSKHTLFAGLDPVATDSIGAKLFGLDPTAKQLPLPAPLTVGTSTTSVTDNHLYLLNQKGMGTNKIDEIHLVGDGASLITSVKKGSKSSQPSGFQLCANYPNPFNPTTIITFYLPQAEHMTLKIYDITGRSIETLIEGEVPSGEHKLQWSAQGLASGVYLCRMQSKDFSETIKMIYQK